MKIVILVAFDQNRLIGRNNELPWHLPADLKYFKSVTMGHHIIMGRKTYDSIGKPLPGRISVVITKQQNWIAEGCVVAHSLEDAFLQCGDEKEVFIIGGAQIFEQSISVATDLYITKILNEFEGDTYFPVIDDNDWETVSKIDCLPDEKNKWPYSFIRLRRK